MRAFELYKYSGQLKSRKLIADVDYALRVSNRARNVTLKVNRANGLVVVVPKDFDRSLLPDILTSRQQWIDRQLERFEALPGRFELDWPPSRMELTGVNRCFLLEYAESRENGVRITQEDASLLVQVPAGATNEMLVNRFVRWLKQIAQTECEQVAAELSSVTGLTYTKLVVRGQKTRWGSYSSYGTLSLNYKLLFLPEVLLRHVILHELAHSVHMNHSADFWDLLKSVDPEAELHDRQLSEGWRYLPAWLD